MCLRILRACFKLFNILLGVVFYQSETKNSFENKICEIFSEFVDKQKVHNEVKV